MANIASYFFSGVMTWINTQMPFCSFSAIDFQSLPPLSNAFRFKLISIISGQKFMSINDIWLICVAARTDMTAPPLYKPPYVLERGIN